MSSTGNKDRIDVFHMVWRRVYRMYKAAIATYWQSILTSRYARKIKWMRRNSQRKFKIVFLVNETSKWKYQQVYNWLSATNKYEIDILLTLADVDWNLANEERTKKLLRNKAFFAEWKMPVTIAYDVDRNRTIPLCAYNPDIVFYQQPWHIADNQSPREVSKYALTLYAPYYIPTYVNPHGACDTYFHRDIFAHFVINDSLKKYFINYCGNRYHVGEFVTIGHPMVDAILQEIDGVSKSGCVIYAPHWSMPHPNNRKDNPYNLSTFLDYGEIILEFAKSHPDIKWIYKPHPSLYRYLVDCKIWSKEKADSYYRQWESLGDVCYDGNYLSLFNKSSIMITDCDSFLAEYALTGKPLVHLIGLGVGTRKFSPYGTLFDTYYRVNSEAELMQALQEYVVKGRDPNKDIRLMALKDSGLSNAGAAERIVNFIEHIAS